MDIEIIGKVVKDEIAEIERGASLETVDTLRDYYTDKHQHYRERLNNLGYYDIETYGEKVKEYQKADGTWEVSQFFKPIIPKSVIHGSPPQRPSYQELVDNAKVYREICRFLKARIESISNSLNAATINTNYKQLEKPLKDLGSVNLATFLSENHHNKRDTIITFAQSHKKGVYKTHEEQIYYLLAALDELKWIKTSPRKHGMQSKWHELAKTELNYKRTRQAFINGQNRVAGLLKSRNEEARNLLDQTIAILTS